MSSISHKIKQIRTYFKLNQTEFGRRIGVPLSTMSKYEQGLVNPGCEFLTKIGQIYKVNLNWLIKNEGSMFEEEVFMQKTGTDDRPYLRLIKNKDNYSVSPSSEIKEEESSVAWNYQGFTDDNSILEKARESKISIIVDDVITGKTKIYNPNGTINECMPDAPYEKLIKKIEKHANNKNTIKYLNDAIDSLSDYKALEMFKAKIEGMLTIMAENQREDDN